MILIYFDRHKLATMNPEGRNPPLVVDNTDTLFFRRGAPVSSSLK